jgi:hypothetical protein
MKRQMPAGAVDFTQVAERILQRARPVQAEIAGDNDSGECTV